MRCVYTGTCSGVQCCACLSDRTPRSLPLLLWLGKNRDFFQLKRLYHWLINCMFNQLIAGLTDWLIGWLVGLLTGSCASLCSCIGQFGITHLCDVDAVILMLAGQCE